MLTSYYCDQDDVERLLSNHGVTSFADHNEDGENESGVVTDCLAQATDEINLYANQRYLADDLADSTLINRWCTTLAAYFLCMRRGNPVPESLQYEFERIMVNLTKIQEGLLTLPGVPMNGDLSPSFSNLKVDRRFRHSKIRVTKVNSSSSTSKLQQNESIEPPVYFD